MRRPWDKSRCADGQIFTAGKTGRAVPSHTPSLGVRCKCQRCSQGRYWTPERRAERSAKVAKAAQSMTLAERIKPMFSRGEGCWPWLGKPAPSGYGRIGDKGRILMAHRAVYELLAGPIPDGMTLDHTCHNTDPSCAGGNSCPHRLCVNPAHLEPVPTEVNKARGKSLAAKRARQTHCQNGHPLSGDNVSFEPSKKTGRATRRCRICRRIRQRETRRPLPVSKAG